MSLRDHIDNPDRRQDDPPVVAERRVDEEVRVPEWRRRALELRDRVGFIAVADLTERRPA